MPEKFSKIPEVVPEQESEILAFRELQEKKAARDALFERIEDEFEYLGQRELIEHVLKYSISDGIHLAKKLGREGQTVLSALTTKSVYLNNHESVDAIAGIVQRELSPGNARLKNNLDNIYRNFDLVRQSYREAKAKGTLSGLYENARRTRGYAEKFHNPAQGNMKDALRIIDEYYAELLRLKEFVAQPETERRDETIELGERALGQAEVSVTPHYYAGMIKDFIRENFFRDEKLSDEELAKKLVAAIRKANPNVRTNEDEEAIFRMFTMESLIPNVAIEDVFKGLKLSGYKLSDEQINKLERLRKQPYHPLREVETVRFKETEKRLKQELENRGIEVEEGKDGLYEVKENETKTKETGPRFPKSLEEFEKHELGRRRKFVGMLGDEIVSSGGGGGMYGQMIYVYKHKKLRAAFGAGQVKIKNGKLVNNERGYISIFDGENTRIVAKAEITTNEIIDSDLIGGKLFWIEKEAGGAYHLETEGGEKLNESEHPIEIFDVDGERVVSYQANGSRILSFPESGQVYPCGDSRFKIRKVYKTKRGNPWAVIDTSDVPPERDYDYLYNPKTGERLEIALESEVVMVADKPVYVKPDGAIYWGDKDIGHTDDPKSFKAIDINGEPCFSFVYARRDYLNIKGKEATISGKVKQLIEMEGHLLVVEEETLINGKKGFWITFEQAKFFIEAEPNTELKVEYKKGVLVIVNGGDVYTYKVKEGVEKEKVIRLPKNFDEFKQLDINDPINKAIGEEIISNGNSMKTMVGGELVTMSRGHVYLNNKAIHISDDPRYFVSCLLDVEGHPVFLTERRSMHGRLSELFIDGQKISDSGLINPILSYKDGVLYVAFSPGKSRLDHLYSYKVKEGVEKEKENKKETKYISEEKALDKLEELLKEGAGKGDVATGLAGLDSERAWEMRERLLKEGAHKGDVATGLAGLDSERAWEMRERLLKEGAGKGHIALGLAGLDSDRAWAMRERLLKEGADKGSVAEGLAGLDSDRAWAMRERLLKEGAHKDYVALGLAGLDSDRAWAMRERLLKEGADKNCVATGLAGLDSERAWEMRERLLKEGAGKGHIALGLAGLDSDRAWAMRERLLKEGADKGSVAEGLAGLDSDRAWAMRERLLKERADRGFVAQGISGDYITFVWQLKNKKKTEIQETSYYEKRLLDLLNAIHKPTPERIAEYKKKFKIVGSWKEETKRVLEHSARFAKRLTGMAKNDSEARLALLETMSPQKPLTDREARRYAEMLFPEIKREDKRSLFDRARGWLAGNVDTSGFFAPGVPEIGDGDPLDKGTGESPLFTIRERVGHSAFITHLLGGFDGVTGKFTEVQVPTRPHNEEPVREVTIEIPNAPAGRMIRLPKSLGSQIVSERVKGIKKAGEEVKIEPSIDALGQANIEVPRGVERIVYSEEVSTLPLIPEDISEADFRQQVKMLEQISGKSLTERIPGLPIELELFAKSLSKLSPREKLIAIEAEVRRIGYYDMANAEAQDDKKEIGLAERFVVMRDRMEELRARGEAKGVADKQYAGVCLDFAYMTTALLRAAGMPAGITVEFDTSDTKVFANDCHSKSFVFWPDSLGRYKIVPIDGTPSTLDPESDKAIETIRTKSLAELITEHDKEVEKVLEESGDLLDKLEEALGADVSEEGGDDEARKQRRVKNEEFINDLKNGKLEQALNTILTHGVKANHVALLERVLGASRYMPRVGKAEEFRNQIALEIENEKRMQEPSKEPAGSRFLNLMREYIRRYSKDSKDPNYPYEQLEELFKAAKGSMDEIEWRAYLLSLRYLEAKKMRE